MLTRQDVAEKLIDYLYSRITLQELVNWTEEAVVEEDFDEQDLDLLRDVIARLGVSDVAAFGLEWGDYRETTGTT